ncbi:DNA translocase FtsK, partial [Candidatus Roizmanbacteria bacterium]|nr:DNA translocase FtsK [Candidatus Roizmanbacteria bacterium]
VLTEKFGGLAILLPFILLLLSGHFFNTKKLKFVKLNLSGGLILIFVSLLGIFQSGESGELIFANLKLDFSLIGAIAILGTIFFVGLILLLDTSIDVFVLFILNLSKSGFSFLKAYTFRSLTDKSIKREKKDDQPRQEFIKEETVLPKKVLPVMAESKQITIKPLSPASKTAWIYPPLTLLMDVSQKEADRGDVKRNADIVEKTLDSFGIRARVSEINYGPAVTQYALEITMGTKLSRITALGNDLALALAAPTGQVRIEAPIPGRSLVGIEIPNRKPEIVTLKKLLSSPLFANNLDPLLVPLGLDVSGQPQATSISKMPHVLIAGATGSGKSVLLNSWISTFQFRTKPENLRMILVDPKRVELTLYNGIPHLLTEVIVEPGKIISALKWTVSEMENRYKEFSKLGVRNLEGYNNFEEVERKPYILFVIDELADLMTFAPGEAEDLITRIAQMARATGIHLILATQRPSVDVITGLMKANIPTRIAFNVSSMIDSRVIIDMPGAEKLLGRGDMLFLPPDQAKPRRIQGPFITEKEVNQLVKFLKAQVPDVHYTQEVTQQEVFIGGGRAGTMVVNGNERDPLFNLVVELISPLEYASASLLQRKFRIGYARAARILDQLDAAGYVGPAEGSKPREVLRRQVSSSDDNM